ncbi:MAG: phosphatase PAP2 family protein [Chthonomonadales bacterium]
MTPLIIFCAKYLFVANALIVLWVMVRETVANRKTLIFRGILVLVLAVAMAKIGGALYIEQRPFIALNISPLIPHNAENGFPSDHALITFSMAFLLFPFSRRAALAGVILAIAVSVGRVASYLHTPIDIIASILMAALANIIAIKVIRASDKNQELV